MSIQFTLNKIYVLLKEIKEILNLKKLRINNYDNSKIYKRWNTKIAEAIEAVLEIDVTIVDENLVRVAGTGIYVEKSEKKVNGYSAFKNQ